MIRLIIATFLLCGFQSKAPLTTIEIISVDMDRETISQVECSQFDQSFNKNEKKLKTVKGRRKIEGLLNELENLKKFEDDSETDTRAQIIIKYQDHVDKFCADQFSVCHNGICYRITNKLKRIIW